MLKELLYKILSNKRNKEQQEVIRLRWKLAEIERVLDQKKKECQYGENN